MDKTADKKPVGKDSAEELMHSMKTSGKSLLTMKFVGLLIFVALLGLGTGFMLAGSKGSSGVGAKIGRLANTSDIEKGKTYGDGDEKIFKDPAEGEVKEGGIDGEGQFHLVRTGGDSQNVYMTSSTVDLSKFIDRKVKVWGQTQKAQKAGWLMDVGKVQVLE